MVKKNITAIGSKQKYKEIRLLCRPQNSAIFSTTGSPRLQNLRQ